MPCVKGSFEGGQILLQVGFFNPKEVSKQDNARIIKEGAGAGCLALLDTGATNSCITARVAQIIGLTPDGTEDVGGVHGKKRTRTYTAGLIIPGVSYVREEIPLFEVDFPVNSPYQALLGMDVLCKGSLQLDFSGNFLFCV